MSIKRKNNRILSPKKKNEVHRSTSERLDHLEEGLKFLERELLKMNSESVGSGRDVEAQRDFEKLRFEEEARSDDKYLA